VSGAVPTGKEEVAANVESKSERMEKRKSKGKGKEKEENKQQVTAKTDAALESGGVELQVDKGEGEVTSKKDKKDKKRKRDEDAVPPPEASSTATAEGDAEAVAADEQPKKKKKDKKTKGTAIGEGGKVEKGESSGVFADEALSEQAQKGKLLSSSTRCSVFGLPNVLKRSERSPRRAHASIALHYVEEHATHHLGTTAVAPGKGWKFNKARQNWLLRHIWSETEVGIIVQPARFAGVGKMLTGAPYRCRRSTWRA
jgi:uncharacterized membrane protein YkoI